MAKRLFCLSVVFVFALAIVGTTLWAQSGKIDVKVIKLAREVRGKGWIVFTGMTAKRDYDLFVMRPDGTRKRNLTNTPDFNEVGPQFSPNGKKMLYRRHKKGTKTNHDLWGKQGELIIANANGSNPKAFGKDGQYPWASWGPNDEQVATLTNSGIEIIDLKTKEVVKKMDRKGIFQQLFWTADGKWFCGTANFKGQSWTVVRLNAKTGVVNAVNTYQNCTPDWFQDSKRMIFSNRPRQPAGDPALYQKHGEGAGYGWTHLYMANGDGSKKTLIYAEDGAHIYFGCTSPDMKYVVFSKLPKDGAFDAPMGVMRLSDAPTVGGKSAALRKMFGKSKDGPVVPLPAGFEPRWTYLDIGAKKK
ncbi:MAG: hypothetical protein QF662_01280 [Phycisphaerae bacterium]|nr:hypothetical protein [Phycisphaerae bacterium]